MNVIFKQNISVILVLYIGNIFFFLLPKSGSPQYCGCLCWANCTTQNKLRCSTLCTMELSIL